MATYNYFSFNDKCSPEDSTCFTGDLDGAVPKNEFNTVVPIGSLCQPGEITKITPGEVYSQPDDSLTFNNIDLSLTILGVLESDWNIFSTSGGESLKEIWFKSWMIYIGLETYISHSIFNTLLQDFENENYFQKLSGPSIAYVEQNQNTLEVSIGLNSYNLTFFIDWINNAKHDPLKRDIANELNRNIIHAPHYVTHVGKLSYSIQTEFVWTFGGRIYNFYKGDGVTNSNLTDGGGNMFAEIKLAGIQHTAKYIAKKDVDSRDPTFGICSGVEGPFCIGDKIYIIDVSTLSIRNFTGTNLDFTWTWTGNQDTTNRKWHVANITNPCVDYRSTPISELMFPIRVISECQFENFD